MRFRSQNLFPIGVLLLLVLLSFWLEYAIQPKALRADGKNRHDPDFMVENFTLRRFDKTGRLQHTLQATKMIHYPDDDTTEVDNPRLTMTGGEVPAHAKANKALVSPDGVEVVLVGDVLVTREASAQRPFSSLTTSVLTVFPDEEISRTNQPVVLTQGRSIVHASALDANNVTGIVQLEGPVRGVIETKKSAAAQP